MSDISVFGQESYFNENVTFFKNIKGEDLFVENINISSNISITSDGNINASSLYVNNNATIAGILTVGTNSVTIDGDTNNITGVNSVIDEIGGYLTTPPGTLIFHCGNTAPSGFLKANGANISRSAYSALFNALGTTFGAGNGSTTFTLPDMRGEFPRGWDDGRGVDSGRGFGAFQDIDWKGFSMTNTGQNTFSYSHGPVYMGKSTSSFIGNLFTGGWSAPASATGTQWDSSEIRPRNIALLACIKY